MNEAVVKSCREDDPNRCQTVTPKGQCSNLSSEGSLYCAAHGGNKHASTVLHNYRLTKWRYRQELEDKVGSDHLKSLHDEVGLLRMILEEKLNSCNTSQDLILNANTIGDMILKIEKLVVSCNKLEHNLGELLDKTSIIAFAMQVIDVITEVVEDESKIVTIATSIKELL